MLLRVAVTTGGGGGVPASVTVASAGADVIVGGQVAVAVTRLGGDHNI